VNQRLTEGIAPLGSIIPTGLTRRRQSAHSRILMPTRITERRIGDVTILQVSGRVVLGDGASELRAYMNDLVDEARLKFLLDLRNVTYIDSFGVGVVAAKYVSVRRKGGDVKLLRLSPRTQRVMRISGLLKIFESFESEQDALNSFSASNQAAG
jgi:anti-sigma B factor antagonist